MVTMLFGGLYQIADGIFVGRFIGEDALAAINLIMPVLMMVFAFSNIIATGSSVHISVLLGEKNRPEAARLFSFSIILIFFLSCVLGAAGWLFAEPFIRLLSPGATEVVVGYGVTYLRVYAVFSPLLLVYFATDNYLRVCGKEKLSMTINILTQVLNIVLDVILIVLLGQGIWAAAFTSCIAMAAGSVITLLLFTKKRMDLYYTRGRVPFSKIGRMLANGTSEFFSNISMSVMALAFNVFLLKYGGTTAVAAMSVVFYVDSVIGMLVFAVCDALQPAISYCYGAGLMKKVRAIFKRILLSAALLSGLSLLFLMFAGRWCAPFFIKPGDTELLDMTVAAMKLFALSYLFGWIDMCFSSYFTALERPARSFLVSLFGTLVFPIAFLFILSDLWGLKGIWLMPAVAGAASGILTLLLAVTMKYGRSKSGKQHNGSDQD